MRSVIMCVDDDKYVLHTLSEQLNEWFGRDYIVSRASGGEEALVNLDKFIEQKVHISVVISDYVMPKMTGDVFLKKVHERDPSIKTIMLTGHSSIDGVVFAINNAGLYRFISKPWDPKDLRLTIMEAIKAYEQAALMARLYNESKSFHIQFADSTRSLKLSFDAALSTIIKTMEKVFDDTHAPHSIAVKYYAVELAKTQACNEFAQFEVGFAGLIHEIGKYTFSPEEKKQLEEAKRETRYEMPIAEVLNKRTCALIEGFGGEYVKIIKDLYSMYKPELPLATRILAIANMFDNLSVISQTDDEARDKLLALAKKGLIDYDLAKVFVSEVPVFKDV